MIHNKAITIMTIYAPNSTAVIHHKAETVWGTTWNKEITGDFHLDHQRSSRQKQGTRKRLLNLVNKLEDVRILVCGYSVPWTLKTKQSQQMPMENL